jgi:hypothetical protein
MSFLQEVVFIAGYDQTKLGIVGSIMIIFKSLSFIWMIIHGGEIASKMVNIFLTYKLFSTIRNSSNFQCNKF